MRRPVRDGLVSLAAVTLYPALPVAGAVVVVRRVRRGERPLKRGDLGWLSRRAALAVAALLLLWIVGTILVGIYSVFGSVPNI